MVKKLNNKQLKAFEDFFLMKKNEIIELINNSNKNSSIDHDGDEVDLVQATVINNLRETLSIRDVERLSKINDSLIKVANGSFGLCIDCGELISEKRLFAVLGCNTCISCASDYELQSKRFA